MNKSSIGQRSSRLRKLIRIGLLLIVIVLLIGITAGIGLWWYVKRELQPPAAQISPVIFTIKAGSDSTQIATLLKTNGLLRNALIFSYYLKYSNQGSQFKAGTYQMTPGLTKDQIIAQLNKGETIKADMLRFTIPEGFTVTQIAHKLSEQNLVREHVFLQLADTKLDFKSKWTASIPASNNVKHRLEGYLFPETYEMKKDSTPEDIIQRMLTEWDRKLVQLPSDWEDKLKAQGMTFHQMVTIASLVEREVVVEEERPIVSGVIHNRLKLGMALQIDATIQYILDLPKDRLFEKDLQVENPYNTYLHPGLPPGPIASPSYASIKAAIYPAETKYLFYVTKKDGSQAHLFAKNFEEHKRNISLSKGN